MINIKKKLQAGSALTYFELEDLLEMFSGTEEVLYEAAKFDVVRSIFKVDDKFYSLTWNRGVQGTEDLYTNQPVLVQQ